MLNSFFDNYTAYNEQDLVESLIIEQIQIYGMEVLYIPAKFVELDKLLGEDPSRAFTEAYGIEMYFGDVDGFQGLKNFITHEGFNSEKKMVNLIVSQYRFNQEITNSDGATVRPMEGDLVYIPLTNELFQIDFADHETVFYQLGKFYTWKITAFKYDYSHENFTTGYDEIDSIAAKFENDDSVINDPAQDNDNVNTGISAFLDIDPDSPFLG